jgi:hypothetical protein
MSCCIEVLCLPPFVASHDHFAKQLQTFSKGFDFLLKIVKNSSRWKKKLAGNSNKPHAAFDHDGV